MHGGEWFQQRTLVTDSSAETLQKCFGLAPIHNPNSYSVIEACSDHLPGIPQVAVFDTAFHSKLPQEATRYAQRLDLARKHGFRKYGFHGLSYSYVLARSAELLGKPIGSVGFITCQMAPVDRA